MRRPAMPPLTVERLIVHLGTYKTGTSSIQRTLAGGRAALAAASVLYPATGVPDWGPLVAPGHHALAIELAQAGTAPEPFAATMAALAEEVRASGCDTVLLSAEDFSSVPVPRLLAGRVSARRVDLIVALRPQHELVTALYYTTVAGRQYTGTPEHYFRSELATYLDYHPMLTRWREAFPGCRPIVRLFERGQPARRDAVADLLATLGLPTEGLAAGPATFDHPTLPARGTLALRAVATLGLTPDEFADANRLLHLHRDLLGRERSVYSPALRREIHETYRASNRRIRRDFLDGREEALFVEPDFGDEAAWQADVGDAAAVARDVLTRLAGRALALAEAERMSAT